MGGVGWNEGKAETGATPATVMCVVCTRSPSAKAGPDCGYLPHGLNWLKVYILKLGYYYKAQSSCWLDSAGRVVEEKP